MATKTYVVSGPLATPYLEDGTRVYLYQGAELPEGLRKGELKRLTDLGLVSEAKAEKSASAAPGPDSVEGILAAVGDDKEKAAAALELEKAKGENARPTLVTKLEAIAGA